MARSLPPLPIDEVLPRLVAALALKPNLILRADTGAGKTSRVPPALLPMFKGRIVLLEPRRVAARAAARRIAAEQNFDLGREVGFHIRFEKLASAATRILVVTEGILVQMLQADPFLEGVDALIFDELHERHLATDLSLAMARKLQREARPELKLIALSATFDPAPLVEYLGPELTSVIDSPGRLFPVRLEFLDRADGRPLPTLVKAGVERALAEVDGDILVFLPGVGEIAKSKEFLEPVAKRLDLRLLSLHGELPVEEQDAVLLPGSRRKVVLATNVAESSITIDGVAAVVDSGLAKILRFDPGSGLDRLETVRISRASAEQRQGRAGRQGPGFCLRLWTAADDRTLAEAEVAEIRRVDLAGTLLELLAWGESDPTSFEFFERPEPAAFERALALLADLGATAEGRLTELGRLLARLPVHPRMARLIVAGGRYDLLEESTLLAALLSERDIVFRPSGDRPVIAAYAASSDVLDRFEALERFAMTGYGETALGPVDPARARQVLRVGKQLNATARQLKIAVESHDLARLEGLERCLLAAYPDRVARRRGPGERRALLVGGRGARLAEMSVVHEAELFLALELDAGKAGERSEALIRQASAFDPAWLETRTIDDAVYDQERDRVLGRRRRYYRDLVLDQREMTPTREQVEQLLVEAAAADPERALAFDLPERAQLLARLRFLERHLPDLGLPTLGRDDLVALLPFLVAGRRSFAELQQVPFAEIVLSRLDFRQQEALDRHAPARLKVPSGREHSLDYDPDAGRPPILAVRIQELFGLAQTPTVAQGRVPVLLHLLAPSGRPQQVTQDLASFWQNTYTQVRKELAGRYPKHSWPTDPLQAPPQIRPSRPKA